MSALKSRHPSRGTVQALARRACHFALAVCASACTTQRIATQVPFTPDAVGASTCSSIPVTSIDVVWENYLQAEPASGLGGCSYSSCHAGLHGAGNFRFASAAEFVTATVDVPAASATSGMRVRMDDLAGSTVYQRLLPSAGASRMPPEGPYLDQQGLDDLAGWICSGTALDERAAAWHR